MDIEEAKELAAKENGYKNWDEMLNFPSLGIHSCDAASHRAMQIYAEAQVKNTKQDTLTEILSYIDGYHGSGHEFWWINSKVRDKVYHMLEKSKEE